MLKPIQPYRIFNLLGNMVKSIDTTDTLLCKGKYAYSVLYLREREVDCIETIW